MSSNQCHICVEDEQVYYDKDMFMPLIRWMDEYERDSIYHKDLDELKSLCMQISRNNIHNLRSSEFRLLWDYIVRPIKRCIMTVYESRQTLDSQLKTDICDVILGKKRHDVLPELNDGYYHQNNDTDNPNLLEMMICNSEDRLISNKDCTYNQKEIGEAKSPEKDDYSHDLDLYF